ncbi:glycosyltransferase family 4 protein [Balneatrix alpica]|uniref:glycosyltransferase family 4 protein n=1 Tax=Balneatrix alpica TaxID=75684 RepID=UPI00273881BE|nr:glycosyltransferase family 1 protein [Balneatrix alpica]
MNVVVNLTSLSSALTGIGYYTFNLSKILIEHDDVYGFSGSHWYGNLRAEYFSNYFKSTAKVASSTQSKHRKFIGSIPGARLLWRALQKSRLDGKIRSIPEGVYWEPNFIPVNSKSNNVITVHDLSHIRHPECHPEERVRFLNRYLEESINKASGIVTVSEFSKEEILHFFPSAKNKKIYIVHPAAGDNFHPRSLSDSANVLKKYNINQDYIVALGTLEPRKNLSMLLDAFSLLPIEIRRSFPLLLIGGMGWKNAELVKRLAAFEEVGEVRRLGYIPDEDLPFVLGAAKLLVYPSIYEGFGMPVLEAMKSGVPVITSKAQALLEVGGEAILSAENKEEMAHHISSLLNNSALYSTHQSLSLKQARRFSWNQSADVLRHALMECR